LIRRGFADHRCVFALADGLERSDKPIPPAWQGLDEPRVCGRISQGLAKSICGRTEAVIEIDERILGPKSAPEFLACDDFSPLF
jgi:hypothetical protein